MPRSQVSHGDATPRAGPSCGVAGESRLALRLSSSLALTLPDAGGQGSDRAPAGPAASLVKTTILDPYQVVKTTYSNLRCRCTYKLVLMIPRVPDPSDRRKGLYRMVLRQFMR